MNLAQKWNRFVKILVDLMEFSSGKFPPVSERVQQTLAEFSAFMWRQRQSAILGALCLTDSIFYHF